MIHNRFCLLVTDDAYTQVSANDLISNSIAIAENLLKSIENKIQTKLAAGIGNVHSIHSIYTSYFEALSCIQYCNPGEIIHVNDLVKHDKYYNFEYKEAEKNMIEAVRLRKPESYNYFFNNDE